MIVQMEAVRAGAGVGLLPRFMASTHPELVCVRPETVHLKRTFWLIVHADLHRLIRIRVICDFTAGQTREAAAHFE